MPIYQTATFVQPSASRFGEYTRLSEGRLDGIDYKTPLSGGGEEGDGVWMEWFMDERVVRWMCWLGCWVVEWLSRRVDGWVDCMGGCIAIHWMNERLNECKSGSVSHL